MTSTAFMSLAFSLSRSTWDTDILRLLPYSSQHIPLPEVPHTQKKSFHF